MVLQERAGFYQVSQCYEGEGWYHLNIILQAAAVYLSDIILQASVTINTDSSLKTSFVDLAHLRLSPSVAKWFNWFSVVRHTLLVGLAIWRLVKPCDQKIGAKSYGICNFASFSAGMPSVLPSWHVTLIPCCIVPWQQVVYQLLLD